MIDRRSFAALLAGAVATPRTAWSQMTSNNAVFYASVGPALTRYLIAVPVSALMLAVLRAMADGYRRMMSGPRVTMSRRRNDPDGPSDG